MASFADPFGIPLVMLRKDIQAVGPRSAEAWLQQKNATSQNCVAAWLTSPASSCYRADPPPILRPIFYQYFTTEGYVRSW
jgi:hypothetical protein